MVPQRCEVGVRSPSDNQIGFQQPWWPKARYSSAVPSLPLRSALSHISAQLREPSAGPDLVARRRHLHRHAAPHDCRIRTLVAGNLLLGIVHDGSQGKNRVAGGHGRLLGRDDRH